MAKKQKNQQNRPARVASGETPEPTTFVADSVVSGETPVLRAVTVTTDAADPHPQAEEAPKRTRNHAF